MAFCTWTECYYSREMNKSYDTLRWSSHFYSSYVTGKTNRPYFFPKCTRFPVTTSSIWYKNIIYISFPPFHKRGVDLLGDLSLFISLLRRYFCQTVIIDKIISIKNCLRRNVFLCMRIFVRQIYEKYVYTPKCAVFLIFRRCLYNVGTRNMYSINFFNLRAIRVLWVVFSSFKHKAPFKLYGFSSAFAVSLPILSRSAIKSTFT